MPTIRRLLLPAAALLALAAPAARADQSPQMPPAARYRAAVLADQPLAYWRFDENPDPPTPLVAEDQLQRFPGTYEGTFQGGPRLGVPHKLGRLPFDDTSPSLELDGLPQPNGEDVHVSDGDALAFAGTHAFTVEGWVRPHSLNSVTRRLVSKEGPDGGWLLGARDDGLVFSRHADGRWSTQSTGVNANDTWTYVAASFDGAVMRIYINGWLAAQQPSTISLPDVSDDLYIGSLHGQWRFYAGGLDELAIYPYALSYGREQAHYRIGIGTQT